MFLCSVWLQSCNGECWQNLKGKSQEILRFPSSLTSNNTWLPTIKICASFLRTRLDINIVKTDVKINKCDWEIVSTKPKISWRLNKIRSIQEEEKQLKFRNNLTPNPPPYVLLSWPSLSPPTIGHLYLWTMWKCSNDESSPNDNLRKACKIH